LTLFVSGVTLWSEIASAHHLKARRRVAWAGWKATWVRPGTCKVRCYR
jgi:hypothetical protein